MEAQPGSVPLTSVLSALGDVARATGDPQRASVSGAAVWLPGSPLPSGEILLVVPVHDSAPEALDELLRSEEPRVIALCGPLEATRFETGLETGRHVIIHIPELTDAGSVITTVTELAAPNRESELRKLTSLQRSFSRALSQAAPVTELLKRLQKQTNAVCLIADVQGRVYESTGTVPLSVLMEQVRKTDAEAQHLSASGWEGLAVRLQAAADAHTADSGWLIVAARRAGFPDAHGAAAAHIAATLVESARHTESTARAQDEAIRAATLDEALQLDPRPDAPELVRRLAGLGFSLGTPMRVLTIAGTHPDLLSRADQNEMQRTAERALESAEIPFLVTTRNGTTVLLAQAELELITRALRLHQDDTVVYLAGIGRDIRVITDVADSFADALIAVRTLRAGRHHGTTMAYEQFDFATRVFASIGLDRIVDYSREFLDPLLKRGPMLTALRTYFQFAQNTKATANALGIHHNTLRYRLSKVENLLEIDLNDPAAVASLFLAITSLDLVNLGAAKHLTAGESLLGQDEGMTRTGITAPDAERTPSESITPSRPPRVPKY